MTHFQSIYILVLYHNYISLMVHKHDTARGDTGSCFNSILIQDDPIHKQPCNASPQRVVILSCMLPVKSNSWSVQNSLGVRNIFLSLIKGVIHIRNLCPCMDCLSWVLMIMILQVLKPGTATMHDTKHTELFHMVHQALSGNPQTLFVTCSVWVPAAMYKRGMMIHHYQALLHIFVVSPLLALWLL